MRLYPETDIGRADDNPNDIRSTVVQGKRTRVQNLGDGTTITFLTNSKIKSLTNYVITNNNERKVIANFKTRYKYASGD